MTEDAKNMVEKLREYAEWAQAHEYEVPIMLSDDLESTAKMIERLSKLLEKEIAFNSELLKKINDFLGGKKPEPGRWLYSKSAKTIPFCSKCGNRSKKKPICPHCGSKMRMEDESHGKDGDSENQR